MKDLKFVFMGTPVFGQAMCQTLVENGYNVVAVVTQPDKAVGRKQIITFSEVKTYALQQGIEVIQPTKIRNDFQRIIDIHPDLIVTCAYGQIIPNELLQCPRLGCINIHASLLPKLRGGAPIQHSIMDGYDKTGITIMEMAAKMDAGDMISQAEVQIEKNDTYRTLHDKLIACAKKLLLETLPSIIDQSYHPIAQTEQEVTFGFNITKEEEHVDFSRGYDGVYNQIRSLIDEPCCYVVVDDKKVKLMGVEASDVVIEADNGTITFINNRLGIVCDNKVIYINQLQLEGKNKMGYKEFKNGAGRNWEGKVCK